MRKLSTLVGLVVTLVAGMVAVSPSADAAGPVVCTTAVTGVAAGVIIPAGASCDIHDATINGNVLAGPNSTVTFGKTAFGGTVTVSGSVLSNPTIGSLDSRGTIVVAGSVYLNGLSLSPSPPLGYNFLCGFLVTGSVTVTNALASANGLSSGSLCANPVTRIGGSLALSHNNIGLAMRGTGGELSVKGSMTVINNAAPPTSPANEVTGTIIGGSLVCGGNNPKLVASANTITGSNGGTSGFC